ncbi:hypothetical protein [Fusibacter sp. JL216-2]|uniref:hypothetical protein n=1 Tax=Fusibacter sp. JL216-2 TaxID=3071453 RepID=UPI003D350C34
MKVIRVILIICLIVLSVFYYNYSVKERLVDIDFKEFNKEVSFASLENEEWVYDPEKVALKFAGEIENGVRRNVDVVKEDSEATITIIEDNYQDDSVYGAKYIIKLIQDVDESWVISNVKWGQKCWPDRGHTNYSCENCH